MELSKIIESLRICASDDIAFFGCSFGPPDPGGGGCPGCIDKQQLAAADALEMQRNHIVALTEQLKEARNEQS